MKTIKERAKFLYQGDNAALNAVGIDGYIKGATEQQEIDIQRTCEWLEEKLNEIGWDECEFGYDDSEDVLEDFKQSMKGE